MRLIDLTGKKFARLTVISKAGHKGKETTWNCVCDCGASLVVIGRDLRCGNTMSCGCLQIERARDANIKHGGAVRGAKTALYARWEGIKKRCLQPHSKSYKNYGGRGITICKEWRDDFNAFREWAFANGFSPELTIERVDYNGDYCPDNCTWIPKSEQSKNRRKPERRGTSCRPQ